MVYLPSNSDPQILTFLRREKTKNNVGRLTHDTSSRGATTDLGVRQSDCECELLQTRTMKTADPLLASVSLRSNPKLSQGRGKLLSKSARMRVHMACFRGRLRFGLGQGVLRWFFQFILILRRVIVSK